LVTHERLSEDIDHEASMDTEEIDDLVRRLVDPLAIAYERSEDLDATFRHLMADLLRQFLGTHKSIRLLVKSCEENPAALGDAMSLVREQVEKVYAVALLLEDPETWTLRYLKDEWRRHYERYLLDVDERSGLELHRGFLEGYAAESIERERVQIRVTEAEKQFVELKYRKDPGARATSELKEASKTIDYFPTPGRVIGKISDDRVKGILLRWQREYGYFSGYSHAMFRKLLPAYIARNFTLTTSQNEKVFDTEYALAIMISYLAIASACAMAASKELAQGGGGSWRAVGEVDLLVRLADVWERLRKAALLGQALWNSGARHFVVPTIGAA
jgi:hypothetical protein